MFEDLLVQWNGSNKARNMLDNRAGVLRGCCTCLMTAGDKNRLLVRALSSLLSSQRVYLLTLQWEAAFEFRLL